MSFEAEKMVIQQAISALNTLIDHEIINYTRFPSTALKVDQYTKTLRELEISCQLIPIRSSNYNDRKTSELRTKSLSDFQFIKLISNSRLVDTPVIGSPSDANDPNEIRRINPEVLSPLYSNAVGIFNDYYALNLNDHIGYRMFINGFFDLAPIAIGLEAQKLLGNFTWLDVGANIGTTSIPLALHGITCIGIEANPSTFAELTNNINLNALNNYTAINRAVVSSEAHVPPDSTITIYSPLGNTGSASLDESWNPSKSYFQEIVNCQTETIDNILIQFESTLNLAIKIDIEGGELGAIQGASNTISRSKPLLLLEWNQALLGNKGNLNLIQSILPPCYQGLALITEIKTQSSGEKLIVIRSEVMNPKQSYENVIFYNSEDPSLRELFSDFTYEFRI